MVRGEVVEPDPIENFRQSPESARRFEFDLGLVLALPGGASLPDGFSLELNGTPLDFEPGVDYQVTDSPAAIAAAVSDAIGAAGLADVSVTTNPVRAGEIAVAGLANYATTGLPNGVILGEPGVADEWSDPDGAVTLAVEAIPIDFEMSAADVGAAMRRSFSSVYGDAQMLLNFGVNQAAAAWPHHENFIRLFKFIVAQEPELNDSGIGVTVARAGDQFGADPRNPFAVSFAHRDERTLNNNHLGVFIDDIVIGFAERGEMVFSSESAGTANPFVPNREYDQNLFDVDQIATGRYQFTARASADYGTTNRITGDLILLQIPPFFVFGRDFDTNDRFKQSLGIQVNADAAGQIADGVTFTLTDTKHLVTFEFDVTADPADPAAGVVQGNVPVEISVTSTAEEIAEAIRDAINSPTVQNLLSITSVVRGQAFAPTIQQNSRIVELHGTATTDLAGGFGFPDESFLTPLRWGNESFFGEDQGDSERERPQGQLLFVGNTITNSAQWGIVTAAGDRDQPFGESPISPGVGDRPYPGAPINFPSGNTQRLAPGVVVVNNILAQNEAGGLRISGDPEIDATVQIARVLNNTFYSGTDGVFIEGGASPVILNNIFADNVSGVRAIGPNSAVLGANLFQSNSVNTSGVETGPFSITLLPTEPLFVSTANRRFYPAAGSRAIDSSLEALQERFELTQVKSPLGLPLSPMLAPDRDTNGLLRVDDPSMNSPDGMGANVFKDRGAAERADFVSPEAVLQTPQDNDAQGSDSDRSLTNVLLQTANLEFFSVLMQDINGTGPDESTVVGASVTLTENGRLLRQDFDYVFGYNANSRTLRLTPLAGIWRRDSVYELTLSNTDAERIIVPAGANLSDGNSVRVVRGATTRVFEFDSNGNVSSGAIAIPFDAGSTPYELAARLSTAVNRSGIGVNSRLEGNGNLVLQGASSVTANAPQSGLVVESVPAIRDLAGNRLRPNRPTGLTQFTIVMPEALQDFGDSGAPRVPTLFSASPPNGNGARHVILPVDAPLLALGTWSGPNRDGLPTVAADGDDYSTRVDFGTLGAEGGVRQGNAGPARLILPAASSLQGQQVVIEDTAVASSVPLTFEFDLTGTTTPEENKVIVDLEPTDDAETVAEKFADSVWQTILSGRITGLVPVADGDQVSMGGTAQHLFDLSGAADIERLSAGNVQLVIPGDLSSLGSDQSMSITDSMGRTLFFVLNPTGILGADQIPVNVDVSGSTPAAIANAFAAAIQSQVSARRLWLGEATAIGPVVSIVGNDEDGITFDGPFNAGSSPVPLIIRSTGFGMVDAWIDWNGDGDFNDSGERANLLDSVDSTSTIATSVPVRPGINVFYVQTPPSAVVGVTSARFRLSTTGGLLAGGAAVGGEVEDYVIEIVGGNPPIATTVQYSVDEDQTLAVLDPAEGVLSNDTDPDILPPEVVIPGVNVRVHDENPGTGEIVPLVNVSHGSLILNADGTFTYTPDPDFNGTDFFAYRSTDGRLISNQAATVTITVNPINDPPQFMVGQDPEVLEDAGMTTIPGWATSILPGPSSAIDELESQLVDFEVTTDRPELFTAGGQPAISSQGTLSFETALMRTARRSSES
jgi:large repetitive protein